MPNEERPPHSAFRIQQLAFPLFALVFLVFHLRYLPASLEDLDSINFAVGLRHFDVAHHNPHPPGYPLFIGLANVVRVVEPFEAKALALVGVVAGTLAVFALAMLFRRVDREHDPTLAVVLAITAPLYWFTTNRPLSDMTGLAAALAVQALILRAETTRDFVIASFCAAFAVGLRSQVAVLTLPLLIATGFGIRGSGFVSRRTTHDARRTALVAYVAGGLAWAIPLVVLTGGPRAYWHVLFDQGAEDLSGIRMLWTTPTMRELVDALYYAFVAPWATWPLATAVLLLAAIGVVELWRRDSRALTLIAIAFGPYLVFDILFQETFTSRYALPLVIPIGFLAAAGARAIPMHAGTAVAIGAAMFSAHAGGTSLAAYSRQPAPAFRLMADMANASTEHPVVGMDRREAFDLRKAMQMTGVASGFGRTLPSPPQHEWLELVKYWNAGGRAPVWFVADPKRTDIDLIGHGQPSEYRWSLPYPVLIDGVRPNEIDWYRLTNPEWYVTEGWSLTPEAAGITTAEHVGLSAGEIEGRVWRHDRSVGRIVIGGRNLDPTLRSTITVKVGNEWSTNVQVPPGAFAQLATVLPSLRVPAQWFRLTVRSEPRGNVAIEQFDYSESRPVTGFGAGWHEPEYNPSTGLRWRWLSRRGDLQVAWQSHMEAISQDRSQLVPVGSNTLHIVGESPRNYFSRGSKLTVRANGQTLFSDVLASDFSLDIPVREPTNLISLETDQTYIPAERSWRTHDHRELGLRIFRCELRPAS